MFLFVFGLAPLVALLAVNLPMVLERMQQLYQKQYVQNLRADFGDLDRYLASRNETTRLLAKFPEPGLMATTSPLYGSRGIELARAGYAKWIDQVLIDHPDVFEIVFVDPEGSPGFRLERDERNFSWRSITGDPVDLPQQVIEQGLKLNWGNVHLGRISIDESAGELDPRRYLSIRLISPIGNVPGIQEKPLGAVMITIDMGGMASRYDNTLWVYSTGTYLKHGVTPSSGTDAFSDFPGLEEIISGKQLALWKGEEGRQVLWVPLLVAEKEQRLWVGRYVDASPINAFRKAVILRIAIIVLVLAIAIWVIARWFANRAERLSGDITGGIQRMLDDGDDVRFDWRGPRELRALGENLTRLAGKHAGNTQHLRAYARQLEDSNRYKSQFLANVSHELHSPLNSILLLSKSMAAGNKGVPQEQVQQARIIHEAGRDLLSLIDDILDLSRIEAGGVVVKPQPVDLSVLLGGIVEMMRPQFRQKDLPLKLIVEKDQPGEIITDPERFSQVIKNFLSNALKFTNSGEVTVRLQGNDGDHADSMPVRISVTDTGIGIPPEKHKIIFEAFQQADGSTSRRFGGTGLGLAISLELTALLGGRIELESREQSGSTFSLLLPLELKTDSKSSRPLLPSVAHSRVTEDPPLSEDTVFSHHSVLVVVNDLNSLLALTPHLEQWGLIVTAAEDADEAIDALVDEGGYSAIIVCLQESAGDACATISKIRGETGISQTPVIVMTGDTGEDVRSSLRADVVDAVISGPFDPEVLKSALFDLVQVRDG